MNFAIVADNPLILLLSQTDLMTRLVLGILFVISVLCWALFLGKCLTMALKIRALKKALLLMNAARTIDDIRTLAHNFSGTLPGYFISKHLLAFKMIADPHSDFFEKKRFNSELLHHEFESFIDAILDMQESYLPFFLTSAAVGPLIGLFGTVWGLIHSFLRISQYQAADMVTMAPGIAEALITTLAGLIVTIPALIMHNYCLTRLRSFERILVQLSDKMRVILVSLLIG